MNLKQVLFLFIALIFNCESFAYEKCIVTHINEAIQLNKARKVYYTELSQGLSTQTSNALIFLEKQMLPISYIFDGIAKKYQKAGLDLFCEDLISMNETPSFKNTYENGAPDVKNFKYIKRFEIYKSLKNSFKNESYESLIKTSYKWIDDLSVEPRFNCLTRHFLEAIIRSAKLAPVHIEKAHQKGMKSPRALVNRYLKSIFISFFYSVPIDETARHTQALGIPIICNDVPAIPIDF